MEKAAEIPTGSREGEPLSVGLRPFPWLDE